MNLLLGSVVLNGRTIFFVVVQGFFTMFIYAVLGYYFFMDSFYTGNVIDGENQCTSIRHCFMTALNLVRLLKPRARELKEGLAST